MIEAHIIEQDIETDDISKIAYVDVFPEDLGARPDDFDSLLKQEMDRLAEGEDLQDAYDRAKERLAVIEAQKQLKRMLQGNQ